MFKSMGGVEKPLERKEMNKKNKIEIFEKAFGLSVGHSCMKCECGKTFYNSNGGWDWENGELEALEKSKNAIDLDYSVGEIGFEGKRYVPDCECWHERAMMIFKFLMTYNYQIIELFTGVKQLLLEEAKSIKDKPE